MWDSKDITISTKIHNKLKGNKEKSKNYKFLFIEMEYCEGNTLREMIDNQSFPDEKFKFKLIRQILEALQYIHSKQMIHRDLKPSNIFLNKENQVKLGDFGLATLKGEALESGVGTPHYISPEQEKNAEYDEKTDMYSLGIIIFEMFYFFDSMMERDLVLKKIRENRTFPLKWEKIAPPNIYKLVNNLTSYESAKRKSPLEILNSNLLPFHFSDNLVFANFKKILNENEKYVGVFIDILTEKIKEWDSKEETITSINNTNNSNNTNNIINTNNINNTSNKNNKGILIDEFGTADYPSSSPSNFNSNKSYHIHLFIIKT